MIPLALCQYLPNGSVHGGHGDLVVELLALLPRTAAAGGLNPTSILSARSLDVLPVL